MHRLHTRARISARYSSRSDAVTTFKLLQKDRGEIPPSPAVGAIPVPSRGGSRRVRRPPRTGIRPRRPALRRACQPPTGASRVACVGRRPWCGPEPASEEPQAVAALTGATERRHRPAPFGKPPCRSSAPRGGPPAGWRRPSAFVTSARLVSHRSPCACGFFLREERRTGFLCGARSNSSWTVRAARDSLWVDRRFEDQRPDSCGRASRGEGAGPPGLRESGVASRGCVAARGVL